MDNENKSQEAPKVNPELELLKAKNAALEAVVAEQDKNMSAIFDRLKSLETTPSSVTVEAPKENKPGVLPKFTVDKKSYQFTVPCFIIDTTRYVADDIKDDKELLQTIVKEYPGIIKAL